MLKEVQTEATTTKMKTTVKKNPRFLYTISRRKKNRASDGTKIYKLVYTYLLYTSSLILHHVVKLRKFKRNTPLYRNAKQFLFNDNFRKNKD